MSDRRFFVPEVVQTSEMDCGPASLKAMLEGHGIPASYGRLREACQTTVDGTSIDVIEDVANRLGLVAEQIMIPADHLFLDEAGALPAIVVVRLPNGFTHFVIAWRRHGQSVQVMDPASGRLWMPLERFYRQLFIHTFPVPAAAWREWAGSDDFVLPFRRRLASLGISNGVAAPLVERALGDPGWKSLAGLDAAARFVASLVRSGAITVGEEAARMLDRLTGPGFDSLQLPETFFSVLPSDPAPDGTSQVLLQGVVLVRVRSRAPQVQKESLPPELAAVLTPRAEDPLRAALAALREEGALAPAVLAASLAMGTLGLMVEALLIQGMVTIGRTFEFAGQRLAAFAVLLTFTVALLLLEAPQMSVARRFGQRFELRLRIAFLRKLPRLGDQYFHSRLTSDLAGRAFGLRHLRRLPMHSVGFLRRAFEAILTTVAVAWLEPSAAVAALAATAAFVGLSVAAWPILKERDLRLRSHLGGLSRFYLDALLGLVPMRQHGAERAFRREHEGLVVEWARASVEFAHAAQILRTAVAVLYSAFAAWLVFRFVQGRGEIGAALLLFYWTLNLPVLGEYLADYIRQVPLMRNSIARVLEHLTAPDEVEPEELDAVAPPTGSAPAQGMRVSMRGVGVQAGGHAILSGIDLSLDPCEHVAIVGPSGAGKSSLVGVLLGVHRPAEGECLVDGQPLRGAHLLATRRATAWVDPAVQLWNRTLIENLAYGNEAESGSGPPSYEQAELLQVFERLERGMQTRLGEGGGLVSGGEGQRVRLGRAMNRASARLVILDEPFRGLDRDQRSRLLARARDFWRDATLLCITHDVGETRTFDRVLVVEDGRILEDGSPASLLARKSRYRAMLKAEQAVRRGLWEGAEWRRLWMEGGRLTDHTEA